MRSTEALETKFVSNNFSLFYWGVGWGGLLAAHLADEFLKCLDRVLTSLSLRVRIAAYLLLEDFFAFGELGFLKGRAL